MVLKTLLWVMKAHAKFEKKSIVCQKLIARYDTNHTDNKQKKLKECNKQNLIHQKLIFHTSFKRNLLKFNFKILNKDI